MCHFLQRQCDELCANAITQHLLSTSVLVHNCTIFLCSLDVRNIVQGGDPLYAVFFLHRALEATLDQNECVFLQKKQLSRV